VGGGVHADRGGLRGEGEESEVQIESPLGELWAKEWPSAF